MAKTPKSTHELITPSSTGWASWAIGTGVESQASYASTQMLSFGKEKRQRILALPAAHLWVIPAWLHGQPEHLQDMALLHLERSQVRLASSGQALQLKIADEKEGTHLTIIHGLKDAPSPLADFSRLPDLVVPAIACRELPADSLILYRELGRLVVAMTRGTALVYCSPLCAHRIDESALSELNHLCLQLSFQHVLGKIESIVLWFEEDEGDLDLIEQVTGLPARRDIIPAPSLAATLKAPVFLPNDVRTADEQAKSSARRRVTSLSIGLALAACLAFMMVLISTAKKEREGLLDQIAELTPRSSQVMDQKKSWIEAAPAVDPSVGPLQVLLDCMQPSSSTEVSMTSFEWTPSSLSLRGRIASPTLAVQYVEEVSQIEALSRYTFEKPVPQIASDNSATFELKGEIQP